jgi:hypothetical protein
MQLVKIEEFADLSEIADEKLPGKRTNDCSVQIPDEGHTRSLKDESDNGLRAVAAVRTCLPSPPRIAEDAVDWMNKKHFVVSEGAKSLLLPM